MTWRLLLIDLLFQITHYCYYDASHTFLRVCVCVTLFFFVFNFLKKKRKRESVIVVWDVEDNVLWDTSSPHLGFSSSVALPV